MKNKNIEKKIKRIMFEKNINQSDLAKKLGITRGVVSNLFTGNKNPRIETLEKIAEVLEVPFEYFISKQKTAEFEDKKENLNDNLKQLIEKQSRIIEEMNKKFEAENELLKKEMDFVRNEINNIKNNIKDNLKDNLKRQNGKA